MEWFEIYCNGCDKAIAGAHAKDDSDVARGNIRDEYYCADCAKELDGEDDQ